MRKRRRGTTLDMMVKLIKPATDEMTGFGEREAGIVVEQESLVGFPRCVSPKNGLPCGTCWYCKRHDRTRR